LKGLIGKRHFVLIWRYFGLKKALQVLMSKEETALCVLSSPAYGIPEFSETLQIGNRFVGWLNAYIGIVSISEQIENNPNHKEVQHV